jgi:hypothetical protein
MMNAGVLLVWPAKLRSRSDLRAAREADRARAMGERESSKAEQDGARTIKPFVAPERI